MKKKTLLITILLTSLIFAFTGCKKEENLEEIVQGEIAIDENYLINLLIEYANEDLTSNTNFTLSFYNDELSEENLQSIFAYSSKTGFAYTYDPAANLDVYQRSTETYWYDRDEKLWYVDYEIIEDGPPSALTEFVQKLNVLTYKFELGDEEIFNSTNCYVLIAKVDGLEGYTNYYITKDNYTLLGTKQQLTQEDIPFYTLISYDSNIELPDASNNAETSSYNDYYLKKTDDGFYEIYESLFGENSTETIQEESLPESTVEPVQNELNITETTTKFVN